jgi:hypothetical protein
MVDLVLVHTLIAIVICIAFIPVWSCTWSYSYCNFHLYCLLPSLILYLFILLLQLSFVLPSSQFHLVLVHTLIAIVICISFIPVWSCTFSYSYCNCHLYCLHPSLILYLFILLLQLSFVLPSSQFDLVLVHTLTAIVICIAFIPVWSCTCSYSYCNCHLYFLHPSLILYLFILLLQLSFVFPSSQLDLPACFLWVFVALIFLLSVSPYPLSSSY